MPKTVETARANLEASISLIPERYKRGVLSADWATKAGSDAAEANWAAAVQRAAAAKRRQSAIHAIGNEQWRLAASTTGASRIGEGIRANLQKYATNFGKVYAAFLPAVQSLPPRGIDAMANVDARLKPVVRAWKVAAGKE